MVCGGREIYLQDSDLCYTYEPYLDSWSPAAGGLSVPRHEAGCAVTDSYGMVISGGYDDVESVEFTGNLVAIACHFVKLSLFQIIIDCTFRGRGEFSRDSGDAGWQERALHGGS